MLGSLEPVQSFMLLGFDVFVWGLAAGVGFLVGLLVSLWRVGRIGGALRVQREDVFSVFIWGVIGAFVGARVGFVALFLPYFQGRPEGAFALWEGGLVGIGGVVGLIIVLLALWRIRGFRVADLIRVVMPGLVYWIGFVGLGSFVSGDTLGGATTVPWSVVQLGSSRHPLGVYYFLFFVVVGLGMMWLERSRFYASVERYYLYLVAVVCSMGVLVLELFRSGDVFGGGLIGPLSFLSWYALVGGVIGGIGIMYEVIRAWQRK